MGRHDLVELAGKKDITGKLNCCYASVISTNPRQRFQTLLILHLSQCDINHLYNVRMHEKSMTEKEDSLFVC